jgi:hypothetical protein
MKHVQHLHVTMQHVVLVGMMFDAYALRMLMIKLLIVFNIRDVIAVARPVTCDRTRPIARGALWTPIEHWVQRVRSNGEARPVTTTALPDVHCCCLSCSDQTRLVITIFTVMSCNG